MVAGGHAWLLGGACLGYDEIQSMSGRYASYWNAFLYHDKIEFNIPGFHKLDEIFCFHVVKLLMPILALLPM